MMGGDSANILLFFAAIFFFGGLLWVTILFSKRGPKQLNVEEYRCEWLEIEKKLSRDNEDSNHLAILNADKLLDKALRERGISGQTMGERMKQLQKTWKDANAVWSAHKLRNKIAHESSVRIDYNATRRALSAFKQALKDVGAI